MKKVHNRVNHRIKSHVSTSERRNFVRHPIGFPIQYKVAGSHNGEGRSKTVNISRGGLLFTAKSPAKELSLVTMKIPFQNRVFSVKGKVARCKFSLAKKLYEIGISFYTVSDAFKTKLIEQLYLINEFRDLRSRQLHKEISLDDAAREWIKRYSKRFSRYYK